MTLSVEDCLAAITAHTRGLAAAAEGNLDRRIEHCPDWSMADLVWHLTSVHWFWNHIATERPVAQPEDLVRPGRPADTDLIAALLTGVATLVDTLRATDQNAPCWTWGQEENVWFITRHQVQEAAVHHWDAVNAAGGALPHDFIDDRVAADAVNEFLTHSVANPRWPMPEAEPLGSVLRFCGCIETTDHGQVDWRIYDGAPGTLTFDNGASRDGDVAGGHTSPADLLLWLYRRRPSAISDLIDENDPIVQRFRAFSFTD